MNRAAVFAGSEEVVKFSAAAASGAPFTLVPIWGANPNPTSLHSLLAFYAPFRRSSSGEPHPNPLRSHRVCFFGLSHPARIAFHAGCSTVSRWHSSFTCWNLTAKISLQCLSPIALLSSCFLGEEPQHVTMVIFQGQNCRLCYE
jgi:hypothetical protein